MKTLKLIANAKLNLYLDITSKRSDGYHNLKTVMQTIDLHDELEFIISDGTGIEIFCSRSDLPLNENNLVYKGMLAAFNYAYFSPGCKITVNLKKNIPSQAGMGGGSADCAAAILAMDKLFHLELSYDELCTAAKMCGADVPFFIKGSTALCEGIGEKITQLEPLQADFAIVKPDESISAPEAYRAFDERGKSCGDYAAFEQALKANDKEKLGKSLYNAFSSCIETDKIYKAKRTLLDSGALGAQMTGSGSAVFGIFDNFQAAEAAAQTNEFEFSRVCRATDYGVKEVE